MPEGFFVDIEVYTLRMATECPHKYYPKAKLSPVKTDCAETQTVPPTCALQAGHLLMPPPPAGSPSFPATLLLPTLQPCGTASALAIWKAQT